MADKNLCQRIREEAGYTQKQLANALNKSERTIRRWEQSSELKPRISSLLTRFNMGGSI